MPRELQVEYVCMLRMPSQFLRFMRAENRISPTRVRTKNLSIARRTQIQKLPPDDVIATASSMLPSVGLGSIDSEASPFMDSLLQP